jgi:hypothetical protein
MTGTRSAPPDMLRISSRAALSFITSRAVKGTPFLERNSFAILQCGQVGL